ncbi:LPP20 family lipoprotein [Treponema sp.]|uniref:LPP20 family lipoprotein n=1 Tax=Treponema sp. TaxID=166 RepID=UPI00388F12D6
MPKIIALFLSFLLVSCGSSSNVVSSSSKAVSQKEPDWINGLPSKYPASEYLTGTGSAVDKKAAEIDAVNELVTIFGQKISSTTASSRRMTQAQNAGIVAYSDTSALGQDVLREVNQDDIIAVEIPEFYESKNEGKWYALAVINREKAGQIYSDMIEKNQAEISSILKQISSDKEPNTLINFSRLDFAEEVAKVNESYLKRLMIINPAAAQKYESISTPVQLHKTKAEMAAKIPVCVKVNNDSDGRIAKSFQEVMSSFGFNTTLGSNERYVIDCKIHLNEVDFASQKNKFCEYAAEAGLNDTFSGETLVPLSITGREGSSTYQNAEVRAKIKIATKIKTKFSENFQKYLGEFSAF